MSDQYGNGSINPPLVSGQMGGAGLTDIATQLKLGVQNSSQIVLALQSLVARSFGSFTMTNTTSITILDSAVQSDSFIELMETNATAGTLQRSTTRLYVSARNPTVSFVLSTSSGAVAGAGGTFEYLLSNPI